MLKENQNKFGSRSEICLFIRYLKGTRDYYLYSQYDMKVFISTTVIFLEDDYIENHKPQSKIILEELSKETNIDPINNESLRNSTSTSNTN